MQWLRAKWLLPLLLVITTLMHLGHLDKPLEGSHLQRQITAHTLSVRYAESDMNLLHPQLFEMGHPTSALLHELPLSQWLVAVMHKLLGPGIWVARITVLLMGFLCILGMFALVKAVFQNEAVAAATAWVFAFSPNFFFYSLTPTPDVFVLSLNLWSLALFFLWKRKEKNWQWAASLTLFTLAALCNAASLVLFLLPIGTFMLQALFIREGKERRLALATLAILPAFLPFIWQKAMPLEPQQPVPNPHTWWHYLSHHLAITLPELMINYAALPLLVFGIVMLVRKKVWKHSLFLAPALGLVAILVSLGIRLMEIGKLHEEAFFLLYPFLFLAVGAGFHAAWSQQRKSLAWAAVVLMLAVPVTAFLRMNGRWSPKHPGFNTEVRTFAETFRDAAPPTSRWVVGNDLSHCAYLYHVKHTGWVFKDDSLPTIAMERFMKDSASHLLSDSRKIEESPEMSRWLGKLVLERGSLRLYELKK
jgi:hypothetical protein